MQQKRLAKTIGDRVKRLREDERDPKVSQNDLAEQLTQAGHRVGQGQIGHIEVGAKLPSPPLLVALARRFNTSTDYLLGLTDNPLSAADLEDEARTGGVGGQIGDLLARLDDGARADLLAIVRRMQPAPPRTREERERALFESFERFYGRRVAEELYHELARFLPGADTPGKERAG